MTTEIKEKPINLKVPSFKFFKEFDFVPNAQQPKANIKEVKRVQLIFKNRVKISTQKPKPFSYFGKTKTIYAGGLDLSGTFHEVSHFLICPEKRLEFNDFGLGIGFNSDKKTPIKTTERTSAQEENLACFLEWVMMYNYLPEKDKKKRIFTVMSHEAFYDFEMNDYINISNRLYKLRGKMKKKYNINLIF